MISRSERPNETESTSARKPVASTASARALAAAQSRSRLCCSMTSRSRDNRTTPTTRPARLNGHRGVEEVGADGRARPLGASQSDLPAHAATSGRSAWLARPGEVVAGQPRVGEHTPVRRDDRDARVDLGRRGVDHGVERRRPPPNGEICSSTTRAIRRASAASVAKASSLARLVERWTRQREDDGQGHRGRGDRRHDHPGPQRQSLHGKTDSTATPADRNASLSGTASGRGARRARRRSSRSLAAGSRAGP